MWSSEHYSRLQRIKKNKRLFPAIYIDDKNHFDFKELIHMILKCQRSNFSFIILYIYLNKILSKFWV